MEFCPSPRPAQCLLVYGLGRGEDPLAKVFGAWPLPLLSIPGELAAEKMGISPGNRGDL